MDDGNTITDFLKTERERGITIQSACIPMAWRDHRINLIDTPGNNAVLYLFRQYSMHSALNRTLHILHYVHRSRRLYN